MNLVVDLAGLELDIREWSSTLIRIRMKWSLVLTLLVDTSWGNQIVSYNKSRASRVQ